jgi:hypothetical protein
MRALVLVPEGVDLVAMMMVDWGLGLEVHGMICFGARLWGSFGRLVVRCG